MEVSVYDKNAFALSKVLEELKTQREELIKRGLWREEVKVRYFCIWLCLWLAYSLISWPPTESLLNQLVTTD